MMDLRPIVHVGYKDGKPNFSQATRGASQRVLVSLEGLRAIDAVLKSLGKENDCRCEVLFNRPNATTYWIWTIPEHDPGPVKKYAVDAISFEVTPQ
jgi:hypothetical protein